MALQTRLPCPPHCEWSRSQCEAGKSPEHATDGENRRHVVLYPFRNRYLPRPRYHRRKSRPLRDCIWNGGRLCEGGEVEQASNNGIATRLIHTRGHNWEG